ncbi:NUDIX domain-containing protein [Microvirga puerhi]|uniref:ADP-ribose pyrophosphatase n=1 Tax=Microvirga puerhi TaxID=2876078 RepID=A0ABS7VPP0_9HYPH|nr:NUDIX domain-containing protein [Microvirga puerhi]MBZ6077533.1 NUDIX domain-containing protein [Microvirga puerhi]
MSGHEIRRVKVLHAGRRNLLSLTLAAPGGETMVREILESPPAATVLPYDMARKTVVLVRQFRAAAMQAHEPANLLEAIAGLIDVGEMPEDAIRREAMEEAGLSLQALEPLGAVWASPGYSTERIHLFLAPYSAADRKGIGGGLVSEKEEIEICEVAIADLQGMIARQQLCDLKTLALIQALGLSHAELFPPAERGTPATT